jgi:16S rRNA (uracil1498-N3)-methyltransferase
MQRYFVPPGQWSDLSVRIAGPDARHLAAVLRARPGERIIAADGNGRAAIAVLDRVSADEVVASLEQMLEETNEPSVRVTVAQGLPKGDKMETVIQKGTEAGAIRFIPFVSRRTVVQLDGGKEAKRLERWARIAKEAAEQAHRGAVPEVTPVTKWRELLAGIGRYDAAFFCYEREESLAFRRLLTELKARKPAADILLIVGPEGGFDEEEAKEAEAAGCRAISLGRRILRTETAALVALSCILYEFGEIGGS